MKAFLKSKKVQIVTVVAACLAVVTLVGVFVPFSKKRSSLENTGKNDLTSDPPPYGYADTDYARLYVQDGLVGNYMSYDGTSLSYGEEEIEDGVIKGYFWKNQVAGGKSAVLRKEDDGILPWYRLDGGIGYRWFHDSLERPMGVCVLPYESLEEENKNYEIEIVAKFLGITDRSAYATGGDMYDVGNATSEGVFTQNWTTFRFGTLHSNHYLTRSQIQNYDRVGRWYASNDPYTKHWNIDNDTCSVFLQDRVFHNNSAWRADVNAVTMTVQNTHNASNEHYIVSYSFQGETAVALDCFFPLSMNNLPQTDPVSRFTLFNGYPCVIYGVRIYDRKLGEAEKLRNSFVDLLAFYGVNCASILELDEETRTRFLNKCAEIADYRDLTMGCMDKNTWQANYDNLVSIIKTYWPGK